MKGSEGPEVTNGGQALVKGNAVMCEFDFVFVAGAQVSVGECKAGQELGEKDFRGARAAAELGVANFYFCSTAGFGSRTIAEIEYLKSELDANKRTVRVHALGPTELLNGTPQV